MEVRLREEVRLRGWLRGEREILIKLLTAKARKKNELGGGWNHNSG